MSSVGTQHESVHNHSSRGDGSHGDTAVQVADFTGTLGGSKPCIACWPFSHVSSIRGIFGSLCLKISRAWHVMGFSSILTGRGNIVAIFGVVGSLRGRNRSVDSLWDYT
jgi:hypothetical protein